MNMNEAITNAETAARNCRVIRSTHGEYAKHIRNLRLAYLALEQELLKKAATLPIGEAV